MLFIHFIAVGKRNDQRLRQRLIRTSPPRLKWLQLHLMTRWTFDIRLPLQIHRQTLYQCCQMWNAQDAVAHLEKRSWLLIRDDGPLVYSTCSEQHSLGVDVEERVELEPCWKELGAGVRSSGDNLRTKKSSLRNKMKRHNDSRAHQYAVSIIDKREEVWKTCTDNVNFLAKSNRPFSDHPEIIRFAPLPLHKMKHDCSTSNDKHIWHGFVWLTYSRFHGVCSLGFLPLQHWT